MEAEEALAESENRYRTITQTATDAIITADEEGLITLANPAADRLFKQAGEKFAAALKIRPDDHEALYNWGNALTAQARTKTGEEADRLFEEA